MNKPVVVCLAALACLGVSLRLVAAEGAGANKPAVVWPAADIKWSDSPAIKGAKIAVLWGDPTKGAYGAFKTIPSGGTIALHTHSHDQRVITTGGTIILTMDGAAPKDLPVGSYSFIPAGAKHTAECKGSTDCTYFEEQPGASDIKFVDAAKK